LFNSMEPHVAPSRDVIDQCRCSPQRVQTMLAQLDRAEIADLADDEDKIEIICEFCKTTRHFYIDNI